MKNLTFLSFVALSLGQKVVITNDDGWAVAMIRAQNDALKAAGYQTVLSAPADNQSGTGSSSSPPTTLEQPCQFDSCPAGSPPEGSEADDPTINYVNSFPVDAVRFGIQTLAPQFLGGAPDLVVSGPNIGNNVVLLGGSGTVGAATEAALEGVPSVAFSASSDSLDSVSFTTLTSSPDSSGTLAARLYAQLSVKLTDALLASPIRPILPPNISLNVNYPPVSSQCSDVSDFHYVLTRVFPNLFGIFTDVDTCGSTSLPDEGLVILRSDCFVSVSVMDARTKTDVNAATQEAVLNRIAALPEPVTDLFDPATNLPQLSEERILNISRYLSEDIGYRTPGTLEHAKGEEWFYNQVLLAQQECQRIAEASGRQLECEIWRQKGDGSHRFDMMGARLYKTYVNLGNIVVRISNGTPEGKEHAVLVNAHLDSTLPTPGAADDALSVGVMLECMRVLVGTPDWSPKHAIILLWNNAEESLQDGSHLFSTQHPVAPTVRAVINLEAAGTKGRELLFQATSEQMIQAPHGTIIANEVFSSGVILSDTDFRQFQEYLNVTGLDMAVVKNSYLYHMRKDLVENIDPGVAQHMADNAMALLQHLSSEDSQLASLTGGYTKPTTAYLSIMGHFILYSFTTAKILYTSLFIASALLVRAIARQQASSVKVPGSPSTSIVRGFAAASVAVVGSVITANVVALVMTRVLNKNMSWFAMEYSTMALFGPPAALGALLSQLFVGAVDEATVYSAVLITLTGSAVIIQFLGVGSAALLFVAALSVFVALFLNFLLVGSKRRELSLWTYVIGETLPLMTGTMCAYPVLDVFVPLAGRLGADAPTDHVMATIVSSLAALTFPLFIPFINRFERTALSRAISLLSIITVVTIAVFAARDPHDPMHQKRVYILRTENITTGEHHLHISTSDGAPGFPELVYDIAKEFGTPQEVLENGDLTFAAPRAIVMDKYNADWDPMFPFSRFLSPYKIPLFVDSNYVSPWSAPETAFAVTAVNDVVDRIAGTRSLKLRIDHPGLIWTVIAFDAHVLKWNLDDNPPDEYTRHHVKEASFYGSDTWSIDLVIKMDPKSMSPDNGSLLVNFIGLQEEGMWPGKKAVMAQGRAGIALTLFERLDEWLHQRMEGKVDALLMGCVAGIERI